MDPILIVSIVGSIILVAILSYLDGIIKKNKTRRHLSETQNQIDEALSSKNIGSLIECLRYSKADVSLGIPYDIKIEQRKKIIDGFRKMGLPAIKSLIAILQDPASPERVEVASILGEIGDRQAVQPLIQIVQNVKAPEQASLREVATIALGDIGDPKAADFLLEVADSDPNADERVYAGCALLKLGDRRAFDKLMKLLQIGNTHLSWSSRSTGIYTLGKMQNPEAIPLLVDHLDIHNLGPDEFRDEVRSAARSALSGMGEPAFEALITVISDPGSGSCEYACYALGEMTDLRALPNLERLIGDAKNRSIRSAAKHALSIIKKNQKQA